jgi:hypothetical protein
MISSTTGAAGAIASCAAAFACSSVCIFSGTTRMSPPSTGFRVLEAADLVDAEDAERSHRVIKRRPASGVSPQSTANVKLRERLVIGQEVACDGRLKATQPRHQPVLHVVEALLLDVAERTPR